jgi:hypothetical protein
MEISTHKCLSIELHNEELETLRQIAILAHDRLRNSPTTKMRGTPVEKQAGLCGPDLYRVKDMLERIGTSVGFHLPYEAEPNDKPQVMSIRFLTIGDKP